MLNVSRLLNRAMSKFLKAFLIIAGLAIVCSAAWLLFRLFCDFRWFHHESSRYTIVARNDVPNTPLHSVGVGLRSDGQFEKFVYPILEPGVEGARWYPLGESPPMPTSISVEFADPSNWGHQLSITGAPPDFRGEICIVITKRSDYAAHLELKAQR